LGKEAAKVVFMEPAECFSIAWFPFMLKHLFPSEFKPIFPYTDFGDGKGTF
jgi:hypothetical protein